MTQFEYIAIPYSMVLSFTVLRALSVLPYAVRDGRRYWIHTAWVFLTLMTTLGMFWNFWFYREIEWTLPLLALALANPAILFVFASLLAPTDASATESWREYFFSIRLRLFVTGIAWDLSGLAGIFVLADLPASHPANAQLGFMLFAHVVGAVSKRPGVQAAIVVAGLLGVGLAFAGVVAPAPIVATPP